MGAIGRQHRNQLIGVAIRLPLAAVRIGPPVLGQWVAVVEDAVRHSAVQQQSFDAAARKLSAAVRHRAVDNPVFTIYLNRGHVGFVNTNEYITLSIFLQYPGEWRNAIMNLLAIVDMPVLFGIAGFAGGTPFSHGSLPDSGFARPRA